MKIWVSLGCEFALDFAGFRPALRSNATGRALDALRAWHSLRSLWPAGATLKTLYTCCL